MRWIDTDEELERIAAELQGCKTFFLDTEFESNRQGTQLAVLQLTAGEEIFLFDAVRLTNLRPLAAALLAPNSTWVLHAGLQDVALLKQALNAVTPPRLFDTQIAWALLTPEVSVSLTYLQYRLLGVRQTKGHQTDDWLRRPLPDSQKLYAASDVEHLPEVYRLLSERLEAKGRMGAVAAAGLELLNPPPSVAKPLELRSFRNAWLLEPASQTALLAILSWHSRLDSRQRADLPPPKTLFNIAARLPETERDLARLKGVGAGFVRRHGRALVKLMADAVRDAKDEQFQEIEPEPYATFAELQVDAWLGLLRSTICTDLELSPELALPARLFKSWKAKLLAPSDFDLGVALDGWREDLLGPALRAFLAKTPPPAGGA